MALTVYTRADTYKGGKPGVTRRGEQNLLLAAQGKQPISKISSKQAECNRKEPNSAGRAVQKPDPKRYLPAGAEALEASLYA